MRTVTYQSVIDKVSGYMGENDGMSSDDAGLANRLFNTRVRSAWEYYWWPELMGPMTYCQFRPTYDPTVAYAASTSTVPTEVYYPPSCYYYQCLQPNTGQLPALGDDNEENSAYWAVSQPCYSGPWWATGIDQEIGDIVRNPADGRFYQCILEHTTGATMDLTKYGILTPFVRSLAPDSTLPDGTPIGEIKRIWNANPDAEYDARQIAFVLRPGYVLVRGERPTVWLEYRMPPTSYTGLNYSTGTTYNAGQQVYDPASGDYYASAVNNNQGVPVSNAANWTRLGVPYLFADYLAQSIYAGLMAREEQVPEDFNIELTAGFEFLQAELDKIERQQGQARQLNVVNSRPGAWW